MTRAETLANRFGEVIFDGLIVANTNYKSQLETISFKTALKKNGSLNTVLDLAQHIHYYIYGVKNVLKGGELEIKDKYSFDFAEITTKKQWTAFLNLFFKDALEFMYLIKELSNETLSSVFVNDRYGSYEKNLYILIEHCYYHLGQIVIINKLNQ